MMRRLVAIVAALVLVLASCSSCDDTAADPAAADPAWLELLREPEAYSALSDQTLENLLKNLGTVDAETTDTPRILAPQFTVGASGLFDTDPPSVLEQISSLFDEAADRESGPAITGIESSCLLDLDDDGQCDQLEVDFQCSRCATTSEISPLIVEVGDGGEPAPIVADYVQRLAADLADDAVLLVDEAPDPLTQRAWQRLSATYPVADDVARFVPAGLTCARIPKVGRLCVPTQ